MTLGDLPAKPTMRGRAAHGSGPAARTGFRVAAADGGRADSTGGGGREPAARGQLSRHSRSATSGILRPSSRAIRSTTCVRHRDAHVFPAVSRRPWVLRPPCLLVRVLRAIPLALFQESRVDQSMEDRKVAPLAPQCTTVQTFLAVLMRRFRAAFRPGGRDVTSVNRPARASRAVIPLRRTR